MCTNDHHLPVVTLASLYGAATSWHCNKFLNPARDGAVLPVLHLNQYKIANPTLLARISDEELLNLLRGYGYTPHMVSGDDPPALDGAPRQDRDRRDHRREPRRQGRAACQ